MTNLYGGSGGALGFAHPFDSHMIGMPARARGSSSGGAIEIVAQNDIILGSNSMFSCVAEKGWGSFMIAGGGGSGGSILIAAGGTNSPLADNNKRSVNVSKRAGYISRGFRPRIQGSAYYPIG